MPPGGMPQVAAAAQRRRRWVVSVWLPAAASAVPPHAACRQLRAPRAARLAALLLLLLCACAALHVWHGHSRLHATMDSLRRGSSQAAGGGAGSPCSRRDANAGVLAAAAALPGRTHRRIAMTAVTAVPAEGAPLGGSNCDTRAAEQRICRIAIVGERHSGEQAGGSAGLACTQHLSMPSMLSAAGASAYARPALSLPPSECSRHFCPCLLPRSGAYDSESRFAISTHLAVHLLPCFAAGTNLAEQLLAGNLDPALVTVRAGLTAHKHWMQPLPADPAEHAHTLLVVPVRNPYDWATALFHMCYCCTGMQQRGFVDFVQLPYTPDLFQRDAGSGLPCTSDVDTRRRTAFGSIIEMRAAKLRGLFDLGRQLGVPVEVVRLEDMLQPEGQAAFVQRLASKYGLPLVGDAGQPAAPEQAPQVEQPGGGLVAADVQQPGSGSTAAEVLLHVQRLGSGSGAADARRLSEAAAPEVVGGQPSGMETKWWDGVQVEDAATEMAGGQPESGGGQPSSYKGGPGESSGHKGRDGALVVNGIATLASTDARWFVERRFSAAARVARQGGSAAGLGLSPRKMLPPGAGCPCCSHAYFAASCRRQRPFLPACPPVCPPACPPTLTRPGDTTGREIVSPSCPGITGSNPHGSCCGCLYLYREG
ncbi:hypothetical protein ABPG75_010913 [Micractinium tetrahymenae]